jgi:hypothetical protein
MALLRLPFIHGAVPEPGSAVAALIGHLPANAAYDACVSLDPGRAEDARRLRRVFPHAPEGSVTAAMKASGDSGGSSGGRGTASLCCTR